MDKWQRSQQMELEHWREQFPAPITEPGSVADAAVRAYAIWTGFGVPLCDCIGATLIDIGCGPTARMACFGGATIIGIDPLIESYRRLVPALMDTYDRLYANEAEDLIEELEGTAYLVACINCLDHCHDPPAVLSNMLRYTQPGGIGFLSVDVSAKPEEMHPSRMTAEATEDVLIATGWTIQRRMRGRAYPHFDGDKVIAWDAGWSPGVIAHHWWLRRP